MAPASATVVLGGTIGLLTGVSGHDANVLAATLPAFLSAAGATVYFVTRKSKGNNGRTCAVSGLVVLFSLAFLGGTHSGAYFKEVSETSARAKAEATQISKTIKARADARERHIQDLKDCTILQFRINQMRKDLELRALRISQVCPFIDV